PSFANPLPSRPPPPVADDEHTVAIDEAELAQMRAHSRAGSGPVRAAEIAAHAPVPPPAVVPAPTPMSAPAPARPSPPPPPVAEPPLSRPPRPELRPSASDAEGTATTTLEHARGRTRFVALVVIAAVGAVAVGTIVGLLLAGD
ncbi:MAG: hypothetical protein K1X88_29340, partial [Nannocystaceae bacterium]|nr:hypothetical protein [Nannocystaceae bacterium]